MTTLYAIVDEDIQIAHKISGSSSKLALFKDLKQLERNAWRYMSKSDEKSYKVAEFEISNIYELNKN